jgi:hypothetical protein
MTFNGLHLALDLTDTHGAHPKPFDDLAVARAEQDVSVRRAVQVVTAVGAGKTPLAYSLSTTGNGASTQRLSSLLKVKSANSTVAKNHDDHSSSPRGRLDWFSYTTSRGTIIRIYGGVFALLRA